MAFDPSGARDELRRAVALSRAGLPEAAFEALRRATALDPGLGVAWRHLGDLLRRAGRLFEASACFERAIAAGDDPALNRFLLAAIGVGAVPAEPPPGWVRELFDDYAGRFDDELLNRLHYVAPRRLAELLGADGRHFRSALDLGCGTGLAGQAVRAQVGRLIGVDAAPRMLDRAAASGVYDELHAQALLAHLQTSARTHDLVIACDVFNYLGGLGPIFAGVRRVLQPGGRFAFTVEHCAAEAGYDLLPTLRYAHSEPYLRELAAAHGLAVGALQHAVLREQGGMPVDGLLVVLDAAAAAPSDQDYP